MQYFENRLALLKVLCGWVKQTRLALLKRLADGLR